ncbi:MAG: hypothetical protein RDU20_15205 [Desulfomonilaceae bacterium]|nr:hypothetical protein [Desulfomonilaceae bacterium]
MSKALKFILASVVGALAIYGAVTIIAGLLTESHGRSAAKAAQPFVSGVTSAVKDQVKQKLEDTPDAELEKDSYEVSKKMYPILKGALLGQLEGFVKDPEREQLPAKMRDAGKAVSEQIVGPFTKGLAEGSGKIFGDFDRAVDGVRKLQDKNKDLVDAIANSIGQLKRFLEQKPLPQPPDVESYPQPPESPQTGPPAGSDRRPYEPMGPEPSE